MGAGASSRKSSTERAEFAVMIAQEVRKQKSRDPDALDCDTLEKAQKEIKRLRYYCSLIEDNDLNKFVDDMGSSLSRRAHLSEVEENRALGVLMAVKEKISKRFVSLREAFSKIDIDKSGFIDKDEFITACQFWGLRIDDDDLIAMMSYRSIDDLRKGINYSAFLDLITIGDGTKDGEAPPPNEETLAKARQVRESLLGELKTIKKAFEYVDADHSGYIDADEMARVFEKFDVPCTRDMLDDLFDAYDTDKDNRICYDEFEFVFHDLAKKSEVAQNNENVPVNEETI